MDADAIRVGLAGYGLAGSAFHAPLIAATDGLELAAIVTANADRAADAAATHPGALVVDHVADVWPAGVDVLVVAAPNRAHVKLAREGLDRGVAVVVDKPLATTAAAARELVAHAEASDGRLTVFHNRRWDGDLLTARRLIGEGALGRVTRFESRFERFRPEVKAGWRERGDAEEGGGQLLDLGSHLVDQARVLFGDPVRVYAEIDTRRAGAQVEDDVFVALEHAGGVRSHLWMGAVAPLHGPRLRVSGLGGGFAVDGLDPQEEQLRSGMDPRDEAFGLRDEPGTLVGAGGSSAPVTIDRGGWRSFYAGVEDWVRGGAPAPVDPADAVAVLEILDAARASARAASVIAL